VLPVIVLLQFAPEGSVILCEDPEAHLHPMAQAELADMFAEVTRQRKLQILLETHSEHLFRRLQYLIADGKMSNDELRPLLRRPRAPNDAVGHASD
jgi:predicted ATPase